MKMPHYVNPNALLSDASVDSIIKGHPSSTKRMKLYAHVAVTNSIIEEMAVVAEKERNHIAAWLDGQGGIYATVARVIREGGTPTLEQPPTQIGSGLEAELQLVLTEAHKKIEDLQVEVESLRGGLSASPHPKPWAVRRKDGLMHYYDTRSAARREADGGIVVDCR